jgi:curved DNA binding protein
MSDSEQVDLEEQEKQENNLADNKIMLKYKASAEIADNALKAVMAACVPDAKIVDLCALGDAAIATGVGKCYARLEKGVAFPTCVSVNHVVGHYCPLSADEKKLAAGDLVKIDLGVHIDGYISVVANTVLVGETGVEAKISGRQGDVMAAAWTAAQAAIRLLKPGNKNNQITEVIEQAAADFKCTPVQGVLSHQMTRFVIDGEKVILNKSDLENKVEEYEFAPNEVYAVDIVMSTAEGKVRESEERTTVFKRVPDSMYRLKMQASRDVFNQIRSDFSTFPFTLRSLDEKKARFAIRELVQHELVHSYPVLIEQEGEFIAHMKFTCLITETGTVRITGDRLVNRANLSSEHSVTTPSLKALLATSANPGKKKKKKKKKAAKKQE